jgi:hypothetical protein
MVEAFEEAIEDAGMERNQIQAAWLGTCMEEVNVGKSALPLSLTLRLPKIPVTRVENFCATGTEAFRGACLRRGLRRLRHGAGPGRGKAQGHRLRRPAQLGGQRRDAHLAVDAQHHGAGRLCPIGQRLRGQAQHPPWTI